MSSSETTTPCSSPLTQEQQAIGGAWKEFEDNLASILWHIKSSSKVEWSSSWGTLYSQLFILKTMTRGKEQLREPLFKNFKDLLVVHVEELKSLAERESDSLLFLRSYLGKWCGYTITVKYIHDIFSMHYFADKQGLLLDIFMYGLCVWRENLYNKLAPNIGDALASIFTSMRNNNENPFYMQDVNVQLIPALIRSQVVLTPDSADPLALFEPTFITPFVKCMHDHYSKLSVTLIGEGGADNISRFMAKAESSIEEELKRVKSFGMSTPNLDQDDSFPDVYNALLNSCFFVCEAISTIEVSYATALSELTKKVLDTLYDVLIVANLNVILAACPTMFNSGRWDDLSRMHRLLLLTNHTSMLEEVLLKHIVEVGYALVEKFELNQKKDVREYVAELFGMMTHYRQGVKCFCDSKFVKIIDSAFETTLNKSRNSNRYLSQYADCMIRAANTNDVHVEEALEQCVDMLNYLQDKDIFQMYYVHYLAKRLLEKESKSIENDNERLMVGKLKLNHGMSYTSKMERMLKDVMLSADSSRAFGDWMKLDDSTSANHPLVSELYPTVIESGAWPTSILRSPSPNECFLPPEVDAAWSSFRVYYLSHYSGRRLMFLSHLGSADLCLRLGGKEFTATMPTYAMCVLSLFNHTDSLSFSDIASMANIPVRDLKLIIKALAIPLTLPVKKKTVKKTVGPQLLHLFYPSPPPSLLSGDPPDPRRPLDASKEDIKEDCVVEVNPNFGEQCHVKHFRVHNPAAGQGKKGEEKDATGGMEERVKKEREWLVDCTIVRVMKARRRLHHNTLVQEVIAQSNARFVPSVQMIKHRVEALIEREFITRDPDDLKTYIYLE